jgi:uncharacterized RDD family membrane protein YckC
LNAGAKFFLYERYNHLFFQKYFDLQMKQGRTILLLLTAIFLLTEIFFNYIVLTNGDDDLLGAGTKTLFFLLFILLFSKRLNWAKWVLSISLILYGILCIMVGFELMAAFYLIGVYHIFFGVYIHKSKALSVFRNDEIKTADTNEDSESFVNTQVVQPKKEYQYPTLVRRYKALLIDSLLVLFTLVLIMVTVQDSDVRTPIMVSSAFIILLSYEPLLTSYSKTVGQRIMKIRVGRRDSPLEKINLLSAYMRWFTKTLLGWLSFVTIHFNSERRAIHDLVSDSVVTNEE